MVLAILLLCAVSCVPQRRYIVTEYVPASQINVPNMALIKDKADKGDHTAQYQYGLLFFNGFGVKKNYREAYHWWKKSAESGNPDAQYALGLQYFNGIGINTDFKEGCRWLRESAQNGHLEAEREFASKCKP